MYSCSAIATFPVIDKQPWDMEDWGWAFQSGTNVTGNQNVHELCAMDTHCVRHWEFPEA